MDLIFHLVGVESLIGPAPSASCKGPARRWMDGWMDGMDGWMVARMDGQMNGRRDGQTLSGFSRCSSEEQSVRLWAWSPAPSPEERLPGRLLNPGLTSSTRGRTRSVWVR